MTRILSAYAYQLAKCQQCNVAVTNCRSAADVLCLTGTAGWRAACNFSKYRSMRLSFTERRLQFPSSSQ